MCGQEQATTKFDVDHYIYIYTHATIHLSESCIAGTLDALSPVRHQWGWISTVGWTTTKGHRFIAHGDVGPW